jgi:hypothetical protein
MAREIVGQRTQRPRSGRQRRAAALGVAALCGIAWGPTVPAAAADPPCWTDVRSDLDGSGPDLVLGVPSYDLPGLPDAGALVVFSNLAAAGRSDPRPATARTVVTAADVGLTPQAGARFGAAVAIRGALLGSDNCADLLVSAPGQDVNGRSSAGRVHLLDGTPGGLTRVLESWDEDTIAGTGGAQAGAGFGAALAIDGSSMIAFGVPGRDLGAVPDAGRVVQLDFSRSGPPVVRLVQQGGAGAGAPERGDRFGEVLELVPTGAGQVLLVGVPREDVGSLVDAGAVAMKPLAGPLSMATQDSPEAGGKAEAGDRYGAALDSWSTFDVDHPVLMAAVGVPGEDLGRLADAGLVSIAAADLFETSEDSVGAIEGRPLTLTQDTAGIPGRAEAGDRFGSAVLTAELGPLTARLRLAVGSPGEDLGRVRDAGMVSVTTVGERQDGTPAQGAQPGGWTQDSAGVSGRAEAGDRFGSGLEGSQLATLVLDEDSVWGLALVTVPGEDIGRVRDSGMAHLGLAPGGGSVPLVPPRAQTGSGQGLVGSQMLVG